LQQYTADKQRTETQVKCPFVQRIKIYNQNEAEQKMMFSSVKLYQYNGKAKQRCVMGVGMCLYSQLMQTKNKQCKRAIILQPYHPHLSNLSSLLLKVSVVSADITIFWQAVRYIYNSGCKIKFP